MTDTKRHVLDGLMTPKELADRGVLSLLNQRKFRGDGSLKYCRIGRKIFYGENHISDFLALFESNRQKRTVEDRGAIFTERLKKLNEKNQAVSGGKRAPLNLDEFYLPVNPSNDEQR